MSVLDDELGRLLWAHRVVAFHPAIRCACGNYPRIHADHLHHIIEHSDWLRAVKAAEYLRPHPDTEPSQDPNLPEPTMSGAEADHEAAVDEDRRLRDVERGLR